MSLTLDVLIATHSPEGLRRVESMNLPRVGGVRYIVSWQAHGDTPVPGYFAGRDDIEIHRTDLKGLGNNRNNAIEHSKGDIMLIADDDLAYTPERLRSVTEAFAARPAMEMASFMYEGDDGKTYPPHECSLRQIPKGFYPTSFELAVRSDSRAGGLRFSPDFGLGSTWPIGEDTIFLLTARRMGIEARFIPTVICRHNGPTTGLRAMTDPAALRGTGACLALEYPVTAPLRIPLKAWRGWRAGRMRLIPALWHMTAGALRATFRYTPPWRR